MKTTANLEQILKKADPEELSQYYDEQQDSLFSDEKPFTKYMREMISEKGLKQQTVFLKADIPERYGYKLISGEKHTIQRDLILRLCLAANFSLKEADRALKLYGFSPLYAKVRRDAVFMICFNKKIYDMEKVNLLLEEHGLEKLYECTLQES